MQQLRIVEGSSPAGGYTCDMNRIAEIREAAGLTQEQLAEMCGTTGNTISRLETGKTKLSQEWMITIAKALKVRPADLIDNVAVAEADGEDVEPAPADPNLAAAIGKRGLRIYRVTGRSVIDAGIAPGATITVDESLDGNTPPKIGDIVLVEIGPRRHRVLRQFLPPRLLVTNRAGANLAISLGDPSVKPQIVGVVTDHWGGDPQ